MTASRHTIWQCDRPTPARGASHICSNGFLKKPNVRKRPIEILLRQVVGPSGLTLPQRASKLPLIHLRLRLLLHKGS